MRFIGLLVTLAIIGYLGYTYLGTSTTNKAKPAEYIDQAQESIDSINKVIKEQQEIIDQANK